MEKEQIPTLNREKLSLLGFQEAMAGLAAKEAAEEYGSGHFLDPGSKTREPNPDFDTSKLTEDDREIWEKIEGGTITMEEFYPYRSTVIALDEKNEAKKSRMLFVEFAGNKAMNAIFEHVFPGKRK